VLSSLLKPLTIVALCSAFLVAPSIAQESTSEDDQLVQDTIVVEYKFPGPPLWKVTTGENELLIFGVVSPVPSVFEWDPIRLERALERADLYLKPPEGLPISRNPIRLIRATRRLNRIKKLPDNGRLEHILPADLYARYVVVRDTYAEDNEDIDRLTPLYAADAIYAQALNKSDLVGNGNIYVQADRLARRSRVERERIRPKERIDVLALVNDTQSIPMEEQVACLSDTLSLLEGHMESLSSRAEIWADGDVSILVTDEHPPIPQTCIESLLQSSEQASQITQLTNTKWLDAADEALRTHRTTVATLPIAEIIEPDGLVSKLLEKGYEIEGPVRSSTSKVGEGPYLGQTPPGPLPQPFAPGIVTTDRFEYGATFTPDLKEMYFTRATGEGRNREFVVFKNEGGEWIETVISRAIGQPLISPDGKTMHLGRRYQERTTDGWSEVKELDESFNEENRFIMRMSSSENGTYFFDTHDENNPDFPLRYSRLINGEREVPRDLSEVINSGAQMAHPFIAPDESYLIWDAVRDEGFGDSDIYISFRDKDGNWGTALNLGDKINTDGWDAAASVTPDGKFIFFHRTTRSDDPEQLPNTDIYWVSADIIEELRVKNTNSATTASSYLGQTPPGLTAKPFAPGIVNTEEWGDAIVFSQDLNEICVSRWKHTAEASEPEPVIFERADNAWRKRAAPEGYCGYFPSPDGQTLYYRAKYKERRADGWSELKSLGPAFEGIRMLSLSSSAEGTLVFDELGTIIPGVGAKGDGLIRYSRLVDGVREDPTPFGKEINTGVFNAHPFIAPDESYMMWDGERDTGYGDSDVYISFRQPDGSWGEAINLGDKVNTDAEEGGAKITPDGKYLFFNRMVPSANGEGSAQSDLFWIDAQIIEDLRPEM